MALRTFLRSLAAAVFVWAAIHSPTSFAATRPDVILVTLDTTRADVLGCYGGAARTPNLDALAAKGRRYTRAYSVAPITLPAHASILSGQLPGATAVHDNGTVALGRNVPTLATVLKSNHYATLALVSSRVLDRRFGLARGFDHYNDRMSAEQLGLLGYPERNAAQLTDAAVARIATLPRSQPLFLWVHYYDAHAPYAAPGATGDANARYRAEVEFVDRELGRLFAALDARRTQRITAVLADHGESLGDHGEDSHGIFLYDATIRVPLIVVASSIEPGVDSHPVSTVGLAATLLGLADVAVPKAFAPPLEKEWGAIFAEARMPLSMFGWDSVDSLVSGRWKAIFAQKPELYDLLNDPGEQKNVVDDHRRTFFALKDARGRVLRESGTNAATAVDVDPELAAQLRSLGYVTGSSVSDGIDPKDGLPLFAAFKKARLEAAQGRSSDARAELRRIVKANPRNMIFLLELGSQELAGGNNDAAISAFRRAVSLLPRGDFTHQMLGSALLAAGKVDAARGEYRVALRINARNAVAAVQLAELEIASGNRKAALALLRKSIAAGSESAGVFTQMAGLLFESNQLQAASSAIDRALRATPGFAPAWKMRAKIALAANSPDAAARLAEAIERNPGDAELLLLSARRHIAGGRAADARVLLQRVVSLDDGATADEARRLLEKLH